MHASDVPSSCSRRSTRMRRSTSRRGPSTAQVAARSAPGSASRTPVHSRTSSCPSNNRWIAGTGSRRVAIWAASIPASQRRTSSSSWTSTSRGRRSGAIGVGIPEKYRVRVGARARNLAEAHGTPRIGAVAIELRANSAATALAAPTAGPYRAADRAPGGHQPPLSPPRPRRIGASAARAGPSAA